MTKRVFITFGTREYHNSLHRIVKQAKDMEYFTDIRAFTDADLRADPDFWKQHGNFIESNRRGYGYWLWKPYLIKKVLSSLNTDDILVYADAGCELNPRGVPRLREYEEIVRDSHYGMISFQLEFKERQYTKRLVIESLEGDRDAHQCMATVQIMRKTEHSLNIVNMCYTISSDHKYINDERSHNEDPAFVDHRHDQSIYSVLVNKYGSIKLKDETYFANWTDGVSYPILAKRLR
jgi:hypothetical protein